LYLDGNASVGREGELPKGLFVKASGYLPGDNVSVTNPMNGETLELLNLGSVDASSGSIMLLSKEAAEGLGVSPDSSLKIKLSSRKGSFDQSAAGVGILSGVFPSESARKNPEPVKNDSAFEHVVELPSSESRTDVAEVETEEPAYEDVLVLEPMNDSGLALNDANKDDSAYNYGEPVKEDAVKTEPKKPLFNADSTGEKIDSIEPLKEEEASALPHGGLDSDYAGEEVAYEEPLGSEYVSESEIAKPISPSELIAAVDEKDADEDDDEVLEEEGAVLVEDINEPVAIVIPVNPDAGPETDFAGEEIVAAEPEESSEEPVAKIDLSVPEDDKEEEEVASVEPEEPYAPIVLVPSEDVTPPKEETKEVVEIKPEPGKENTPTKDIAARLRKESELDRSRYYIQIATLSENSSAQNLIDKYGKYPLAMIRNSRGAYRVLVGPLSVDEYGMVLERFKGYGFKDAFVKYPGSL